MAKSKKGKIIRALFIRFFIFIIILAAIIGAYFYFKPKLQAKNNETTQTSEPTIYIAFLQEIYNKIQKNYWQEMPDEDLTELYRLAIQKLEEQPEATSTESSSITVSGGYTKLEPLLKSKLNNLKEPQAKKDFTVNLASLVLSNLQPFGRSGLYTTKKVQELSDNVKNIDETVNLYEELGIEKDASEEEINQAHQQKTQELTKIIEEETAKQNLSAVAEAKAELALVDRAQETLANPAKKAQYDETGVESTAKSNLLTPNISYLQIQKFSPTTYEEFINEVDRLDDYPEAKFLILDLRGNIGGSVDYLPSFLGLFLGNNQYAYDWYHQNVYTHFRTNSDKLKLLTKYKRNTLILIDEVAQSSAEVMAATLKKYNLGLAVGTKTRGWGTIEKVFPLDNQIDPENETYSMFLVHSVTLRDTDGQPIEGRGIEPDINITDENWQEQLLNYFENQELVDAVGELWGK